MNITRTVTVERSPEDVYAFWRNFENFPLFMRHLERVENTGAGTSHWAAKGPAGQTVEWDAEIVEDRPNELISWRTMGVDDDISHSGAVLFAPMAGDRATEVRVELVYDPPGGKLGASIAKLFGEEPGQQIADDLRRFKQVLEARHDDVQTNGLADMPPDVSRVDAPPPAPRELPTDTRI